MLPELFRIPWIGMPIHGYGAMILAGFLVGTWLFQRAARRYGRDPTEVGDLALWLVIGGLLGARIFYFIQFYDENYAGGPWYSFFKIWEGGLVLYGGLIGGLGVLLILLVRGKLRLDWRLGDAMAPAMAVGIGFGRIGCLFNGCCWGKVCSSGFPLGIPFPDGSHPANALLALGQSASTPIHATQIYESVGAFLLGLVLWQLLRRDPAPGVTFGAFFMLYGALRFLVEQLRGDHQPLPGTWPISQSISVLGVLAGGALIGLHAWRGRRSGRQEARRETASA